MTTIEYRPEIDGLRAFAVVPVILYHMGFGGIPGGFLGVDVFFVISGFLITSIIQAECDGGTFSLQGFWRRRIKRILPALTFVTACTLLASRMLVMRPLQHDIGRQALATLGSVANIYFWRTHGDYWSLASHDMPFLHAWSLANEEQFYLLFPAVFWLVLKRAPARTGPFLLTAIACSFVLFAALFRSYPRACFYLLPARAWELGAGCWAATWLRGSACSPYRSGLPACVGIVMVLLAYVACPQPEPGSAIAVIGAVLVVGFGQSGITHRLLSQPLAIHIGKISYSLYLWHWPVLVLSRTLGYDVQQPDHASAYLLLVYLLALASYHAVEVPGRRPDSPPMPFVLAAALVAIGAFFMAATPRLHDTSQFAKPHSFVRFYDLKPTTNMPVAIASILASCETPERTAPADAYRRGGIIVGDAPTPPRVVVLGNSHGTMWSDAIRDVVERGGVKTAFISINGEPPFLTLPLDPNRRGEALAPTEKYAYDRSRLELIEQWAPDLVIICCRWSVVTEEQTKDLLAFLERRARRVLLMEQVPEVRGARNASILQYLADRGIQPEEGVRRYVPAGNIAAVARGRTLVRRLSASHRNCGFIPVHDLYTRGEEVLILDGRETIYFDDDHITTYGARLAIPTIEKALDDALQPRGRP